MVDAENRPLAGLTDDQLRQLAAADPRAMASLLREESAAPAVDTSSLDAVIARAIPKSQSLTSPSKLRSTLEGETSR